MSIKKKLSSNMEDYLEAILNIIKEKSSARVKDISRLINVKYPSVTCALTTLANNGLVIHEKYGCVELTPKGEKIALDIQKRHKMLRIFLMLILKIDPEIAEKDACKIEHSISPETLEKIIKFIEFVKTDSKNVRPIWLKRFDYFTETGKRLGCDKEETGKMRMKTDVLFSNKLGKPNNNINTYLE